MFQGAQQLHPPPQELRLPRQRKVDMSCTHSTLRDFSDLPRPAEPRHLG
jgi:hypothetical protein